MAPSKATGTARALVLDAVKLIEKLRRTSRDAHHADTARESMDHILAAVAAGNADGACDAIQIARGELQYYEEPARFRWSNISPDDTRLAKQAQGKLSDASRHLLGVVARTARNRRGPLMRHYGDTRRTGDPYDQLVRRPELRSGPLSKHYARVLKAALGRGAKVDVEHASSTAVRGWDYGNYTRLRVVPPGASEPHTVDFTLNVKEGQEASGIAFIDPDTRHSIPIQALRSKSPDEVIGSMLVEVRHALMPQRLE